MVWVTNISPCLMEYKVQKSILVTALIVVLTTNKTVSDHCHYVQYENAHVQSPMEIIYTLDRTEPQRFYCYYLSDWIWI